MVFTPLALLLIIRVYPQAEVAPSELQTASRVASTILHNAGVQSRWFACPARQAAGDPEHPCRLPPTPTDILIRVTSSTRVRPGARDGELLGNAYVDPTAGRGSLATVFEDRVSQLGAAAGLDTATLLGRTMAHEVGHLLLGTTSHAPIGLMRPVWTIDLLERHGDRDWQFTRDERTRLIRNLDERTQTPAPGPARNPTP